MISQWSHSDVTLMSMWHQSDITVFSVISQRCHGDVTAISQRCHGDVTAISQRFHGDVTPISWSCHGDVTAISRSCHGDFTAISRRCHGDVTVMSQLDDRLHVMVVSLWSSSPRWRSVRHQAGLHRKLTGGILSQRIIFLPSCNRMRKRHHSPRSQICSGNSALEVANKQKSVRAGWEETPEQEVDFFLEVQREEKNLLGLVLILLCDKTPNQERHHVPRSQSAGEQLWTLSNRSCWWRRWRRRRRRGRTQTLRWNKMEMLLCCNKVCSSAPTPAMLQNHHRTTEPADWLIRPADSQT